MTKVDYPGKSIGSDVDRARMVIRIAEAAQAHTIICVTEHGSFAQHFLDAPGQCRIIAATATPETYDALTEAGLVTLRLPLHAIDKHRQIRHVLSVALKSKRVSAGELVVCAVGQDVYPGEANLVVVTEVEPDLEELVITDLVKLTDGIRPKALDCAVAIACKIGRAARRGKRIGAMLMIGDSLEVLEGSKQLIPNPFQGHDKANRTLMNPDIHDAIVELSELRWRLRYPRRWLHPDSWGVPGSLQGRRGTARRFGNSTYGGRCCHRPHRCHRGRRFSYRRQCARVFWRPDGAENGS